MSHFSIFNVSLICKTKTYFAFVFKNILYIGGFMKKIFMCLFASVLTLFTLVFSSCTYNKVLEKPKETSLEFWITDNVSSFDFTDYNQIDGVFGAKEYYGKGYEPVYNEIYDIFEKPKHYVIYTLTGYPDCLSKGDYVTGIEITDPAISVYGITCNSSFDEFDSVFTELGCEIESTTYVHTATYKKCSVSFWNYSDIKKIFIKVEVTNKYGVNY